MLNVARIFRFTAPELQALRRLVGTRCKRVVSDGMIDFAFELGDRHLRTRQHYHNGKSQNGDEDAISIRPEWLDGASDVAGTPILEDVVVHEIRIVRTILWFTDFVFDDDANAVAGAPTTGLPAGGYEECLTSPKAPHLVEAPIANLVDTGFVATVNGRDLACFTQSNCTMRRHEYVEDIGPEFGHMYDLVSLADAEEQSNDEIVRAAQQHTQD